MGGPQAFLWPPHPLRGHLPSPRFGWWGYASTSLCPPSQKDARIYVPDATSSKRAQGLRRPSCHSYSLDCVEWVFEEVRRHGVPRSSPKQGSANFGYGFDRDEVVLRS